MPQTCDVGTVAVTAFICANCALPGLVPDPAGRSTATALDFAGRSFATALDLDWPFPVREVLVPCTGRLQPEHVLKAFETGSDLVITISCEKDNCRYLQGSQRWARRADYVMAILDEVGLGGRRLLLFYLPGAAAEDNSLGAACSAPARPAEAAPEQASGLREAVLRALDGLIPNPLGSGPIAGAAEGIYQQVDGGDEDNED
jgi:coenzyme F420-reducing hydrogenase delta subunit